MACRGLYWNRLMSVILTERFGTETLIWLTGYEQKGQLLHLADEHWKVLFFRQIWEKLFTQKLPWFSFRLIYIFRFRSQGTVTQSINVTAFYLEGGGGRGGWELPSKKDERARSLRRSLHRWFCDTSRAATHMSSVERNEIQTPYDKHHKMSSLIKSHQKHTQFCQIWSNMKMSNNPAIYEILIKQYLRSILDISV